MGNFTLDSLEIRQFRVFQRLKIERLRRVNLIVGKNNVGKTCLLEALWLYARQGAQSLIWDLLEARGESSLPSQRGEPATREAVVRHLFHGRRDMREPIPPITIGPSGNHSATLSLTLGWYTLLVANGRREFRPLSPQDYGTAERPMLGMAIRMGFEPEMIEWLHQPENDLLSDLSPRSEPSGAPCIFLPAGGLNLRRIGQLWDSVALTDLEDDVLSSLHLIAPEVQRINLIAAQGALPGRIPVVRLAGAASPVSLGSLGEGMNRLFGIALALVNAKGGLLLVDEIESGLHYSVQPDLWRLVFRMAHRLDVQVFATSHSWDCVASFQQAAQEDTHEQGQLIRLQKHGEAIDVTLFDEHELAIATREQIEVR
jgi:hypothetical protein